MSLPDPMGHVISTLESRGRPMSSAEIGQAIGLTREHAGAVLNQLRRAGVVRTGPVKPGEGKCWRLT